MLLSLQRRQRADEARARADAAAAARRARDEHDAEVRAARKEEQARRRQAILAQYKLKKAIEEAEREVSRGNVVLKHSVPLRTSEFSKRCMLSETLNAAQDRNNIQASLVEKEISDIFIFLCQIC